MMYDPTPDLSVRFGMNWKRRFPFLASKIVWITSLFFGLLGGLLVLFITSRYGAGVSGDSVDYLSTANSLKSGQGFVDYSGSPYVAWPPLYPVLLAGMSWLTGQDTFSIGRILNLVLFCVLIGLSGVFFYNAFPKKVSWPIWGMLVVLFSPTLLRLASAISTDILFIVLVMLYAILGAQYFVNRNNMVLFVLSLIAGFAAVLRWHGVILIASVVLLALIANYRELRISLFQALSAGILSSSLFFFWVIGRNFRQLGTLVGFRETNQIDYLYNLIDSSSKIARWLFPVQLTEKVSLPVLSLIFLLVLMILNRRADWRRFLLRLTNKQFVPLLIFIPIYYVFVIGTSITYEHTLLFDDRYYAPLFLFFFLLTALVADELVLNSLQYSSFFSRFKSLPSYILGFVLFAWVMYPAYGVYKYAVVSHEQGEPTYNIYNTKEYNESQLIKHVRSVVFDPQIPIYSNVPAAVYFFTGITTLRSPNNWITDLNDIEYLRTHYQNWPPSGEAYLIWFPYDTDFYYSPEDVSLVVNLTEIYTSSDGNIYYASRK